MFKKILELLDAFLERCVLVYDITITPDGKVIRTKRRRSE